MSNYRENTSQGIDSWTHGAPGGTSQHFLETWEVGERAVCALAAENHKRAGTHWVRLVAGAAISWELVE